ncbi:MAG: N-formylglutamate amidohydrolase [Candidatus Hydrogenedentes bacterium]|nr:N-formylglutamate amidohydrolase [Candidatus Hydrogenedentota bacterium]
MHEPCQLILTCEHGGNQIPPPYQRLFANARLALESHRGWDPGALELAQYLARRLPAPLIAATVSRLLVELNRSVGHPQLFSVYTERLSREEKDHLLTQYYYPHRNRVEEAAGDDIAQGRRLVHIGVHSFTPILDGRRRDADLGLLYDPVRPLEKAFCAAWRRAIEDAAPELRVRRNYPYRGAADGLTTYLRRRLPTGRYLGIELEVNQAWAAGPAPNRRRMQQILGDTLPRALEAGWGHSL